MLIKNLIIATFLLYLSAVANADGHKKSEHDHPMGGPGLIAVKSMHDVKTTADKLEKVLNEKGMTVFTRINHGAGAQKVGVALRPTELVIFGNPKVGSPLMACAQSVGIDLPQKMLIWEDDKGDTWLTYNNPEHLKARHNIQGCDPVLKKVAGALKAFSTAAAK